MHIFRNKFPLFILIKIKINKLRMLPSVNQATDTFKGNSVLKEAGKAI